MRYRCDSTFRNPALVRRCSAAGLGGPPLTVKHVPSSLDGTLRYARRRNGHRTWTTVLALVGRRTRTRSSRNTKRCRGGGALQGPSKGPSLADKVTVARGRLHLVTAPSLSPSSSERPGTPRLWPPGELSSDPLSWGFHTGKRDLATFSPQTAASALNLGPFGASAHLPVTPDADPTALPLHEPRPARQLEP